MILGITGGTGCGKTTLLDAIREKGGLVLDCDAIYHELLKTDTAMLRAIADRFPEAFDGGIFYRKKLGAIVFKDKCALDELNAITHSAVRREVMRQLESAPVLAAIDAIALFESGLNELCDYTVAITAPVEDRVLRLVVRDQIPEDYARSRIAAQHSDDWFISHCDYVLCNDKSFIEFQEKCFAFLQKLL